MVIDQELTTYGLQARSEGTPPDPRACHVLFVLSTQPSLPRSITEWDPFPWQSDTWIRGQSKCWWLGCSLKGGDLQPVAELQAATHSCKRLLSPAIDCDHRGTSLLALSLIWAPLRKSAFPFFTLPSDKRADLVKAWLKTRLKALSLLMMHGAGPELELAIQIAKYQGSLCTRNMLPVTSFQHGNQ